MSMFFLFMLSMYSHGEELLLSRSGDQFGGKFGWAIAIVPPRQIK
jgi:hypothetical protein